MIPTTNTNSFVIRDIVYLGLPIFIESPKGTYRHWKDPHANNKGSSYMYYDYGYIKNTLGTDGDEVDVYIGPCESSRVFIVTQMKAPEFKEVDEQKVMLGFNTLEQAREAYLYQYNDSRFLGSICEVTLGQFMRELVTQRGDLINPLNTPSHSARILSVPMHYSEIKMTKSIEMLKSIAAKMSEAAKALNKPEVPPKDDDEVSKALKASDISSVARRMRFHEFSAASAEPQPAIGTNRTRPEAEPPVVPVRKVEASFNQPTSYEVLESCKSCNTVHKSNSECPKCSYVHQLGGEAVAFRLRGR